MPSEILKTSIITINQQKVQSKKFKRKKKINVNNDAALSFLIISSQKLSAMFLKLLAVIIK